jgi:hypothetical protein
VSGDVERRKPHAFDELDFAYPAPAAPRVTRDDFGKGLSTLVAAFPGRPVSRGTGELYYRALAHHERADFAAGVRAAVDTCEQWPAIATLRRLCDEARAVRRHQEGVANIPGQPVSAARAVLIAEMHAAEAMVASAAHGSMEAIAAAAHRHAKAVAALRE